MSKITPSIPKGTRDFTPEMVMKRNYIFGVIKNVFEKYGFVPLETPAMENLSTLTGKYGEEGDKLLFRILNSGDFLSDADDQTLQSRDYRKLASQITKKGLRYDLTVPLARYVVMHQNEISFPFKRYQIQPVWRADRPQKGRYQEFYQCDADVIGSDSLINEAELLMIMQEVFHSLKLFNISIKVNHRKLLEGMAELIEAEDKFSAFVTILDKLDKIGFEKMSEEFQLKGFEAHQISFICDQLRASLNSDLAPSIKVSEMKKLFQNEKALHGLEELSNVFRYLTISNAPMGYIDFDLSLARGLDYYTGCIFEVKDKSSMAIGSIAAGGRYDNLTELFGLSNVSGVGFSFGIERIYDLMEELKLFPETLSSSTKVLFINFGEDAETASLNFVSKVRSAGINAEIFPSKAKLDKQMKYSNNKKIPFVVLAGTNEIAEGKLTLKNMITGEQEKYSIEEIIEKLK